MLATARIHDAFQPDCNRAERDFRVATGRYIVMPDHVHLFVVLPPEGMSLARWIGGLRTVLGKELLAEGFDKPHWQEGFFDHLLRNGESYSAKWDYVRMNPVRAGLTNNAEEWPYRGEIVPIRFD